MSQLKNRLQKMADQELLLLVDNNQDVLWRIVDNMEKHGGSFVQSLAVCLRRADSTNSRKLTKAFVNYIRDYLPENWK